MTTLRYKDYEGSIDVSIEGRCFHGKILFVDDLVTYEGKDFSELETAFHEAVEDYLLFCKEVGKEPEKPYKGVFNVRVKPETHRALAVRARRAEQTLNELVSTALEHLVSEDPVVHTHRHIHEHVIRESTKRVHWENLRVAADAEIMACAEFVDENDIAAQFEEPVDWTTLKIEQYGHC